MGYRKQFPSAMRKVLSLASNRLVTITILSICLIEDGGAGSCEESEIRGLGAPHRDPPTRENLQTARNASFGKNLVARKPKRLPIRRVIPIAGVNLKADRGQTVSATPGGVWPNGTKCVFSGRRFGNGRSLTGSFGGPISGR